MFIEISADLMVNISSGKMMVEVLYNHNVSSEDLTRLESIIVKHRNPDVHQQTVGIIAEDNYSPLEIKYIPVTNAVEDISKYYNDDFLEFDELIKKKIRERNSKGLIMLHGDIGSGNTTYIRHLISSSNTLKNFIYLPMELSHRITLPSFLTFLINNAKNSVLIIEDSEQLLTARKIN